MEKFFEKEKDKLLKFYNEKNYEAYLWYARRILEKICIDIYKKEISNDVSSEIPLNKFIRKFEEKKILSKKILNYFRTIQLYGNFGTHYQEDKITEEEIVLCNTALNGIINWYIAKYSKYFKTSSEEKNNSKKIHEIIWEVVQDITKNDPSRSFTIPEVIKAVLKKYPNLNKNTIRCNFIANCVNHPSRKHYKPHINRYWKIDRVRYCLYKSQTK